MTTERVCNDICKVYPSITGSADFKSTSNSVQTAFHVGGLQWLVSPFAIGKRLDVSLEIPASVDTFPIPELLMNLGSHEYAGLVSFMVANGDRASEDHLLNIDKNVKTSNPTIITINECELRSESQSMSHKSCNKKSAFDSSKLSNPRIHS